MAAMRNLPAKLTAEGQRPLVWPHSSATWLPGSLQDNSQRMRILPLGPSETTTFLTPDSPPPITCSGHLGTIQGPITLIFPCQTSAPCPEARSESSAHIFLLSLLAFVPFCSVLWALGHLIKALLDHHTQGGSDQQGGLI